MSNTSKAIPPRIHKILVVDDDWLNRDLLATYLKHAGYEPIQAQNGAEAISLVQKNIPDLVLCDVQMPGISGYEVCRSIKSNAATRFVPIVMVTALDSDQEKLQAVEAGADDFVTKPFNSILLLTRVKSLLRIKLLHDEVEARNTLLRQVLTRYMAEGVVDTILTNPERYLRLGGETRFVTTLFADIRGFTAFTETTDAQKVVETLNRVFSDLTATVFANHGTFDKYLGDCIMAFWGAPIANGDDSFRAIKAAMEMRQTFNQLRHREPTLLEHLGLGIGVNSGDATVGNIGSEKVMDYTAIGDTVNVAKRLQEIAHAGEVLISEATYHLVRSQVTAEKLEERLLHGKRDPVVVYSVKELIK